MFHVLSFSFFLGGALFLVCISFVLILFLLYFLSWKNIGFPSILVFLSCWLKVVYFYSFISVIVCLYCVVRFHVKQLICICLFLCCLFCNKTKWFLVCILWSCFLFCFLFFFQMLFFFFIPLKKDPKKPDTAKTPKTKKAKNGQKNQLAQS